jgi:type IV pilus assembly protein PilO
VFFAVVTAVLLYVVVWNARKDELAELAAKELSLREEFKTKHGKAVNLDLYKQQLVDIEKSFGAMLRQLPGKTELENLLVDISQAGAQAGLQQDEFKPQPEQSRDFYAEKPIKLRLSGSYHQMGEFVSNIAALYRVVTLHDMTIRSATGKTDDKLVMDVTAKTYRYLDADEVAGGSAARKKAAK